MHFGENELSRNAIGFSPLSTPHPTVLQHRPVRASRRCYPSFTLGMDRSFRFASAACDYSALFGLGFPTASPNGLTSPHATTPWLIFQEARSQALTPSHWLVGPWFQVLFHSPPGVLFTVPSRYYSLSVSQEYLALPGGPGRFPPPFTGAVVLGSVSQGDQQVSHTGLSPSMAQFSNCFCYPLVL